MTSLGNVLDMSGVLCQCLGISEGVLGELEGVGGLRGMSGSLFSSMSINFQKSQMKPLTFCNRPEDPNVSNIKMSQSYGRFDLLGSLGRGFRAEI